MKALCPTQNRIVTEIGFIRVILDTVNEHLLLIFQNKTYSHSIVGCTHSLRKIKSMPRDRDKGETADFCTSSYFKLLKGTFGYLLDLELLARLRATSSTPFPP
jgi:hypothetical protein